MLLVFLKRDFELTLLSSLWVPVFFYLFERATCTWVFLHWTFVWCRQCTCWCWNRNPCCAKRSPSLRVTNYCDFVRDDVRKMSESLHHRFRRIPSSYTYNFSADLNFEFLLFPSRSLVLDKLSSYHAIYLWLLHFLIDPDTRVHEQERTACRTGKRFQDLTRGNEMRKREPERERLRSSMTITLLLFSLRTSE